MSDQLINTLFGRNLWMIAQVSPGGPDVKVMRLAELERDETRQPRFTQKRHGPMYDFE